MEMRYVCGAGFVLVEYLRAASLDHMNDPFMMRILDEEGNADWRHASRIMQMGSAVLELRKDPGFPEICKRLRTRDLQSTYFELMSAYNFKVKGCDIVATETTGKKKEDFDFAIKKGNAFANVEVTALRVPDFSSSTVINALHRKRTQLPDDSPAIIVCVTPSSWNGTKGGLDQKIMPIGKEFLERTRRINYVVFATEEFHTQDSANGVIIFTSIAVRNDRPRRHSPALDELMFSLPPSHFMAERMRTDFRFAQNQRRGSGLLIDWVDWALGMRIWRGSGGIWYRLSYDQE